jgi:hypothetical protein
MPRHVVTKDTNPEDHRLNICCSVNLKLEQKSVITKLLASCSFISDDIAGICAVLCSFQDVWLTLD